MEVEHQTIHQKVRKILFLYRATPLANGEILAEKFYQRKFRIKLDVLKPTKSEKTQTSNPKTRQLNVGDEVQAQYYSNNKARWEIELIIKKFDQLHYTRCKVKS